MNKGDMVKCKHARGYGLTEGKQYEVVKYEPKFFDTSVSAGFTWPAYVKVVDDYGREVFAHADRFEEVV